jgi:hypothetical protein
MPECFICFVIRSASFGRIRRMAGAGVQITTSSVESAGPRPVTGAGSIQYTRIRAARAWLHLAFSLPEVGMDEESRGKQDLRRSCTIGSVQRTSCVEDLLLYAEYLCTQLHMHLWGIVGRRHASLLTNLDAWHSEPDKGRSRLRRGRRLTKTSTAWRQ